MANYNNTMYLSSESGYAMPFHDSEGIPQIIQLYGNTSHPITRKVSFNHGVEFSVAQFPLVAMADGVITTIGQDDTLESYMQIRHGDYWVTYGYMAQVSAVYGQKVKAGDVVGTTGRRFHLNVKYKGEFINPLDFLNMITENCRMQELFGNSSEEPADDSSFNVASLMDDELPVTEIVTQYDEHQQEISELMAQYFNTYFQDVCTGRYKSLPETKHCLTQMFSIATLKNVFFEKLPSMLNPFGAGKKAAPIATRVQEAIICDFLSYLGVTKGIFLKGTPDLEKKK